MIEEMLFNIRRQYYGKFILQHKFISTSRVPFFSVSKHGG